MSNSSLSRRDALASIAAAPVAAWPAAPALAASKTPEIQSISAVCVAPDGKLIISDWRQGKIHAVALPASPAAAKPPSASFNVTSLDTALGRAMRLAPNQFRATAMAVLPDSGRAVVAIESESRAQVRRGWLAIVDASGRVELIDPARFVSATVALDALPGEGNLWGSIPARSFLVTSLSFIGGQLYAAGLSNADFSSTLRRFVYPFNGTQSRSSVEMYHTIHNQWETRAPIRAFTSASLNGEPHLVAAYTCTPLIVVPMRDLDQPQVKAKTVAELGYGNTPVAMVPFAIEYQGQRSEWILVANRNKSADLLAVPALAGAANQPGLTQPVKVPFQTKAGVSAIEAPITGMLAVADQDPQFLLGLRRNVEQGSLELASFRKGAFFRLSDHVNEYDFPTYRYPEGDPFQQEYVRPFHRMMKTDEGHPSLIR